jgi:hypothetical protein
VHGGDGDGEKKKPAPKKKPVKRSKITGLPIREPKPKPKLDSERAVANWVHDEVGITGMTGKKKPFLTSLKRDKGGGYRVSTYRRRRLSLEYALRDMGFEPFKTDLRTKHFYDVSKGMDWRSDKFYVSLTEKKVASGEHMLDVEIHERRKAPPTIPQGKEISTVIEDRITA